MDVTTLTGTTAPKTTAPPTPKITSDFDTFLRMLTVQMQNQDPLNPIDSADYAVQLATFSGVEQQVRTNQLLVDMAARLQQQGMAEVAGWIGKEARTNAPVRYDGQAVDLTLSPAPGATRAVLVVKDAQGNLVAREEVPARAMNYQWLGAGSNGTPLPNGSYKISLESLNGEQVIETRPIEHYASILEARNGTGGISLVLAGGEVVPASAVTALRAASNDGGS